MTRIDAGTLLPNDRMQEMAAEGEITQIHRGHAYAEAGDTFDVNGTTFEVADVEERQLGDLTDEDARAEGASDLEGYRERLQHAHGDGFEWDDDADVVRHRFERTD
ncbi:hypothetical protein BRD01_11345 [Halobacteriales archaeon QS_8_65_32]|jgi:hypothetical protein|nr:MAG: hypothetical protein BRD01_11345 [Halobacteriales archaeon QS_8_65_32]